MFDIVFGQIVPESKRLIFVKGDGRSTVSDKILSKNVGIASAFDKNKSSQLKLTVNMGAMSAQKSVALARKHKDVRYLSSATRRPPRAGDNICMMLGRSVKYQVQAEYVEQHVTTRFDRGDPSTFEEAVIAVRTMFSDKVCNGTRTRDP